MAEAEALRLAPNFADLRHCMNVRCNRPAGKSPSAEWHIVATSTRGAIDMFVAAEAYIILRSRDTGAEIVLFYT